MKQNKTIVILGGLLVLLVALWWGRAEFGGQEDEAEVYMAAVNIEPQNVTELRFTKGEETVTLVKQDEQWMLNDLTADTVEVSSFLESMLQPTEAQIVSETSAQHEKLNVTEMSGAQVVINPDSDGITFWLGSSGSGGAYVRREGDDRVYLIEDVAVTDVAMRDTWIDTTLVRIPEAEIQQISTSQNGTTVMLEQRDGAWYEQGSETALDTTGFQTMLTILTAFATQGLADDIGVDDLGPADLTVEIARVNGETIQLNFYEGEEDTWYATSSEKSGIFTVLPTTVDDFELSEVDLKPVEEAQE